jgi:hypothetical protein
MAKTFFTAQALRITADYDLNKPLSRNDARALRRRVRRAIAEWRSSTNAADRDFKRAFCMLMLLKGRVRPDD